MATLAGNELLERRGRGPLRRLRYALRRLWQIVRENELTGLGETIA
ncbi:MAG: hypothetical protein ACYDCQ_20600 [Dehalococcoidia bacterium]